MERLKTMKNNKVEKLVKRAIKGDDAAFGELISLKLESIMFGALNVMKQHQDAEDAAQEIIIKMYDKIKTLREPAAFNVWMHTIINNHCYNVHNKRKKNYENTGMEENLLKIEEFDREFLPQYFVEDKENRLLVREIIKGLPDQKRTIVTLFYYDDLSYKEIAQVMDLPVNTVGSELKRAKAEIKAQIMKKDPLNGTDTASKSAAVPALTYILTEQAREEFPRTTFENLMKFTYKDVLAGSAVKKTSLFSIKKAIACILCTVVITGGVVYACDGHIDPRANVQLGTTQSSIDQAEPEVQSGEIDFVNGTCQCGHVNPGEITITNIDESYEDIIWTIVNNETKAEYTGSGASITEEVSKLFSEKMDGVYTATFNVRYEGGEAALKREFLIHSGEQPPQDNVE